MDFVSDFTTFLGLGEEVAQLFGYGSSNEVDLSALESVLQNMLDKLSTEIKQVFNQDLADTAVATAAGVAQTALDFLAVDYVNAQQAGRSQQAGMLQAQLWSLLTADTSGPPLQDLSAQAATMTTWSKDNPTSIAQRTISLALTIYGLIVAIRRERAANAPDARTRRRELATMRTYAALAVSRVWPLLESVRQARVAAVAAKWPNFPPSLQLLDKGNDPGSMRALEIDAGPPPYPPPAYEYVVTDTWNSSTAKQVLAVGETPTPQAGKWGWGPPTEELWQEISTAYGYYMKLVQGGTDSDMALWTQQLMQLVTTGSKFTGYPFENYGVWRLTASLPGLPAQLTSITPMASWLYGGRTTLQGLDQLSLKGRVYVFSQSEASASQYPIDFGGRLRTGALTPSFQPPIATLALTAVMLSADGKYAYASFLNGAGNGAICQYGITADGTLTPAILSSLQTPGIATGLALSPDGRSAYVTASSQESPPSVNQVVQCSIAADGSLSLKTRSSVTTGAGPSAIAISADGKHAYVTNTIGNTMTHFLIAADGTLSDSSDSVATGTHPYAIALSADGKNAYVANENAVWQYSIAADGTLPSQTPASLVTADGTQSIVLSSDGLSAYVVAAGSSQVFQFSISTGGTLSPKSPATVTTGNPPTRSR